jgi:hypothetical protein
MSAGSVSSSVAVPASSSTSAFQNLFSSSSITCAGEAMAFSIG